MSERKRLKEEIANNLKSESVSKLGMSYEQWLASKGYDSETLAEKELKARKAAERSLGSYGANAESSGGSGGYADYITQSALRKEREISAQVKRERELGSTELLAGYASYIRDVKDGVSRNKDKLLDKLLSDNKPDSASVYDMAIQYGLDESTARQLEAQARSIKTSGKTGVRNDVMKAILEQGMNEEQAYRYALACGIAEGDADKMADIAGYYKTDVDRVNNELYGRSNITQETGFLGRLKKTFRRNDKFY